MAENPFDELPDGNWRETIDQGIKNLQSVLPKYNYLDYDTMAILWGKKGTMEYYNISLGYNTNGGGHFILESTNELDNPTRSKLIPAGQHGVNGEGFSRNKVNGKPFIERYDAPDGLVGGVTVHLDYDVEKGTLNNGSSSGLSINYDLSTSIGYTQGGPTDTYLVYATAPIFDTTHKKWINDFKGNTETDSILRGLVNYFTGRWKKIKFLNTPAPCDGTNAHFLFLDFPVPSQGNKKVALTGLTTSSYNSVFGMKGVKLYTLEDESKKQWKLVKTTGDKEPFYYYEFNNDLKKNLNGKIWTNDLAFFSYHCRKDNIKLTNGFYVPHPRNVDGGYNCKGEPWGDLKDPTGQDSELSGPIKDLLDQHKKTFYLLGKKTGEKEPKLYLFDLGQVGGVLTYTSIKEAIVYKQVSCTWQPDEPIKQDLKLSTLEGEIDTNFYLLTMDKVDQPSKITKITLRMANEYLVKYFPACRMERPEGGGNPNDNLKPDFGGGSGGGSGGNGGIGGGGFFPDVNNPLPKPEIPPCFDVEGGSNVPVSEIYLLKVPELTPSYDDTYDFNTIQDQVKFFQGKPNFKVSNYSYLRKENAIQVGSHVDNLNCYNYLMYRNMLGKWYYCFIMNKQYINERTARIIIATDVMQTYLFDYKLGACYVERCHVDRWKADGKTPTDEFEPEGLEFGEPVQIASYPMHTGFTDTYIAVCSNPLGVIPSRDKMKQEKGVDINGN